MNKEHKGSVYLCTLYIKPGLSLGWTHPVLLVRNAAPEEAAGKASPFKSCPSSSSLLCFMFLQDDSPPVYPTSPGPVPITLAMDHVVVRRRDDGVFYLTGELPLVLLSLCTPRLCWRRLGCAACCWEGWALRWEQSLCVFSCCGSSPCLCSLL